LVVGLVLLPVMVVAATIHVPADQPTIQAAINAAVEGDTVLVADGHYYERITFLGKGITVASNFLTDGDTLHIRNTVIDGDTLETPLSLTSDTGSVVRFVNDEDSTTHLCGFTIQNGTGIGGKGGGVFCYDEGTGKPQVHHCRIEHNSARGGMGGGVYGSLFLCLTACSVSDNSDGGIYARHITLDSCTINHNGKWGVKTTSNAWKMHACRVEENSGGGVLSNYPLSGMSITDCTVSHNSGGGIGFSGSVTTLARQPTDWPPFPDWMINCVVESNSGSGVGMSDGQYGFSNCTFSGNTGGGIGGTHDAIVQVSGCKFVGNSNEGWGGAISCRTSNFVRVTNTLFANNTSPVGGAIVCADAAILGSTFVGNAAVQGSAIYRHAGAGHSSMSIESCLVTFGAGGPAIERSGDLITTTLNCSNIYGNSGGDWVGCIVDQAAINGNISANPLFCDTSLGDYTIRNSSPCAPANNSCGVLTGAFGVACENAAPLITSPDKVTAYEDVPFSYIASFTDTDGPAGVISYLHYPSWLAVDSTELHGTPPNGSSDSSFLVIVSDGFLADSLLVAIAYLASNDAPVLQDVDSASVNEGDTLKLHLVAYDIDSDSLHFAASGLPLNSSFVDSGNGRALFEFSPDSSQAGVYLLSFTVHDDSLAADTLVVPLTVLNTNAAPVLDSVDPKQVFAGLQLQFVARATDFDGDSLVLTCPALPAQAAFVDSGNGRGLFTFSPDLSQIGDHSVAFYASDGALEDTLVVQITVLDPKPTITKIVVDGDSIPLHVKNHRPTIAWSYSDPVLSKSQTHFEIAVGTDNDWQYAEKWNPAPFASAEPFVVYDGAPLDDGQTYWLRLRVSNSLAWSNSSELMFRMNSVPAVPQLRLPLAEAIVSSQQPGLTIRNSTDAESDSLLYTFEVSPDSFATTAFTFTKKQDADSLTTLIVDSTLVENRQYWWRVKASDYYEQSTYSETRSFWVNSVNSAPTAVSLTAPANSLITPLALMRPTFGWTASTDPDPYDTLTYNLTIAIDSNFTFVQQIPNLTDTSHTLTTDLQWGKQYWWNVKANDRHGGETWSPQVLTFRTVTLGDANNSNNVDISDVVYLIAYIFSGGSAPSPLLAGDANCDSIIDISDAVYLIAYIFSGGLAPCGAF